MVVDSYGKEVARKVIHVFALVYPAIYLFFAALFSHQAGLLALGGLLVLGIIVECLRLQLGVHLPLIGYLYNFRRKKELEGVGAEIYFLLGVIVSLALFDRPVALAAILMTVFGDLAAALAGKRWGRLRPQVFGGKKSIEGFAAALAVNLIIGVLVLRAGPGCFAGFTLSLLFRPCALAARGGDVFRGSADRADDPESQRQSGDPGDLRFCRADGPDTAEMIFEPGGGFCLCTADQI